MALVVIADRAGTILALLQVVVGVCMFVEAYRSTERTGTDRDEP
ncbi:hypothetical protein [Brachybacterium ginsengisoli]|nr:hypothetical protein [Brachybacterium ginsengisoli]